VTEGPTNSRETIAELSRQKGQEEEKKKKISVPQDEEWRGEKVIQGCWNVIAW